MHPRLSSGFGFRIAVFFALLCASSLAVAANVRYVGPVGYAVQGANVVLTADRVENNDTSGTSGQLRMELWAFAQPFNGTAQNGFRLATNSLGTLAAGASISNISATVPFTPPPNGTWYFTLFLSEFTGATTNDGYSPRVFATFPSAVIFGSGPPFVPVTGVWWNPAESGSGFTVQVRNGVLVLAVYSYKPDGDAEWYLVSGALTDNGTRLVATLDKYRGGQCIGCAYTGPPVYGGSDGTVIVQFTSATSGTVTFPNGRVKQIEPYNF